MNFYTLIQSKAFKDSVAKIYSIGASIVVIGALFKIQHWPGAGFMLSTGLITEAFIFLIYAFDTDEEPEQVYPEIIDSPQVGAYENGSIRNGSLTPGEGSLALAKFDELLENAQITPDLFLRLGDGMKKLGETAENFNAMGDVAAASMQYMQTIKSADGSLEKLAKMYESTINKMTCKTVFKYKNISQSLETIEDDTRSYHQQMKKLNKNVSTLNSIYEVQRKGAEEYLSELGESLAESRKYREEMKKLNENLTALNNVYGNMLGAMKMK
jgi:gliding motility-associated protein GldL